MSANVSYPCFVREWRVRFRCERLALLLQKRLVWLVEWKAATVLNVLA
jgi:hypothetical protein